jgi:anaerobic magnesium-protoporphyrin IX monomethyl ester cyclase
MAGNAPRILFITTPIRPVPTDFVPIGSLSVMTTLRRAGYTGVEFYNIDLLRPSYEDALARIVAAKPDILAVSAVVSTAYAYTKRITLDVKKALPGTTVILGGNLGASAEILLRKTGVEYIATGEGETTMLEFVKAFERGASKEDYRAVPGLAFLDGKGELAVTRFPDPLPPERIYDVDLGILEELGQLQYFIRPAAEAEQLAVAGRSDPRVRRVKELGLKSAQLVGSKGCVARCTFCHRWDKGIRYIPMDVLMERVDWLIKEHNVGHLRMGDENFGTDKKWLGEWIAAMKKRNILWEVGGMRVNCISPEWIERMRDAGCLTIYYGMESGSQRMLDVMEKKTTAQQNRDTMRWMIERGMHTIMQLIVGMPGENHSTVAETADYIASAATIDPKWNPNNVSVNFAQALPGTPLYETGRARGLIGRTLDDEEAYLLKISDRDARDGETTVNFTGYPRLILEKWHFQLENAGRHAYIAKYGIEAYRKVLADSAMFEEVKPDSGYFADPARSVEQGVVVESGHVTNSLHAKKDNTKFDSARYPSVWSLIRRRKFYMIPILHPLLFMRLRPLATLLVFLNASRKYGLRRAPKLVTEYLAWRAALLLGTFRSMGHLSLRKLVAQEAPNGLPGDTPAMAVLRAGR